MHDRRSFLTALAATSMGACARMAIGSSPEAANATLDAQRPSPSGTEPIGPVGVQLYTLRDAMQQDLAGTLARVARIGYKEVEFAGYFGKSPSEIRAILDANGLRAPSSHVSLDMLEGSKWSDAIRAANTIGHEYLLVAWLAPEQRRSMDDYRRHAALFNRAAAEARRSGVGFGYHNHDFEFMPFEGHSTLPYDMLLTQTDPALVQMEMDLYWTVKAGQDPLAYFARHPGRFPLVHVKDSAGPPDFQMTPVGLGTIDFARIFARRRQAGIRHYFVEHDNPTDPWASIETSFQNVSKMRV